MRAAIRYAGQYGLPITLFGHSMGGYAVTNIKRFSSLVEFLILIAQGKNDEEVLCDTVSIFCKQELLRKTNIQYLLFDNGIRSTHMGIIRGDEGLIINEDLLRNMISDA